MTFEFELDFDMFCDGKYELIFDKEFWPELRNKYANEELILAKRAVLIVDGKECTVSSINEESFLDGLNEALSQYCRDGDNQIGQKTVYVEFSYLIPLKITLKPKNRKTQTKLKK